MFQNKEDTRIHNTKQYVIDAFKELLKETNFENISISMIIKKAGVGRTTFYRHFYTKEDILLANLNLKTMELVQLLNLSKDLNIYDKEVLNMIKYFFKYWDENPDIINLIILLDKTHLLYQSWSTLLVNMFSSFDIEPFKGASKVYMANFAVGGLTSLLIQWFQNNRKESVGFISKHFYIPDYTN